MKFDLQSDRVLHVFWATITADPQYGGVSTTEQWIYVFCAIFGAMLSFKLQRN